MLGVVSTFRGTSDRDPDLPTDRFLADAVGVALVASVGAGRTCRPRPVGHDRSDQATGMMAAQPRIAPADALALLRAHAFAGGRSRRDVAEQVVGRRLDFRSAEEDGPG